MNLKTLEDLTKPSGLKKDFVDLRIVPSNVPYLRNLTRHRGTFPLRASLWSPLRMPPPILYAPPSMESDLSDLMNDALGG